MRKDSIVIALGTPHRKREPGKQSPDGRLKECVYGREIASGVAVTLQKQGYKCLIDYMPLDLPKQMQSQSARQERQRELACALISSMSCAGRTGPGMYSM